MLRYLYEFPTHIALSEAAMMLFSFNDVVMGATMGTGLERLAEFFLFVMSKTVLSKKTSITITAL